MKITIILVHFIFVFSSFLHAQKIDVLLISGKTDKYHNWQIKADNYKTLLKTIPRFRTEELILNDSNDYNLPKTLELSKYKVIILNINNVIWQDYSKRMFENYIQKGGGLVIMHEADNAFPEWPEFNEMIGLGGWGGRNQKTGPYYYFKDGKYVTENTPGPGGSHGKRDPFVINVRDSKHPITKGLPLNWLHVNDELYSNLRGPAKNIHTLATAFSSKETGGSGKEEPVLFTLRYGKGRIFHSVLGHTTQQLDEAFQNLGFQITFLRGTEWAATGKVKQKLPLELPSIDKATLRNISKNPATSKAGFVKLFNGKNFDGWYLKIRSGDANEAKKVYAIDNGMVHVYKNHPDSLELNRGKNDTHGLFYTNKKYSMYIFKFEYKWGTKIANNFKQFQYDAGMYYHVYNDAIWPQGIEYQIRYNHITNKNHTGDFWASGSSFQWFAGADGQFQLPSAGGKEQPIKSGEHRGSADAKYNALNGKWNSCEVIVMGNQYAIHKLNGKIVNMATNLSLSEGIIGLQSETAEIYYRNIMIKEFDKPVPMDVFLK